MKSLPLVHKRRKRGLVIGVAMLALCSACSSSSSDGPTLALRCETIIDSMDAPADPYTEAVLDRIVFPMGPMTLGARRGSDGSGFEEFQFSKFGLVVRSGTQVVLEVEDADGAEFALAWGAGFPPDKAGSISVGPCQGSDSPQADDAAWVVFAGGIWLSEPACVTFSVSSDGLIETYDLEFDAACPG